MRELVAVPAVPQVLVPALRAALDLTGPAVLPVPPGDAIAGAREVAQQVAVVVRTSGSSGSPKSVALSARALLASAAATESALGGPGGWVLALPGYYIAGVQVIVRAIAAGGEPRVLPPGSFTAEAFAAEIAALPADVPRYSAVVATQLHRIVGAMEERPAVRGPLRSLDALLVGGGRLDGRLRERADRVGLPVRRTYGSSETAGGCVYNGAPLVGVEVRVRDGEVQLAGPMLAEGYLDEPARTAEAFLDEPGRRWYRTGDAGEWDGERLAVTGRLDDVIISGGEKVSLAVVERAVQAVPGLEDAVVVRAADAEWGEVPVVVVTAPVDLSAVRSAVSASIGRAAAPRRVLVVPEVPMLSSGKPDRLLLERLAAE